MQRLARLLDGDVAVPATPDAEAAAARRRVSVVALLLSNAVPLVGVLFLGWDLFAVMALWWAETAIIGALNVLKMIWIHPIGGVAASIFFCVHFGGFMFVHGVFVGALFAPKPLQDEMELGPLRQILGDVWIAVAALAASHLLSFLVHFVGAREYLGRTVQKQMTEPYGRVVAMHLAILFGGFLVLAIDQPLGALVILVAVKTAIDAAAHVRGHRPRAAAVPAGG